jgi:hypothetical protein
MYLNMLRTSILPAIHMLHENEQFYCQQDDVHHHTTTKMWEPTSMRPCQVNG